MKAIYPNALSQALSTVLFLAAVLAVSCFAGCESNDRSATNTAPKNTRAANNTSIPAGSLSQEMIGQTVNVTGVVVEQCPASGCWFKVKSDRGETFVSLISSRVRLSENRLGQQARVTGEVTRRGSDLAIEAKQVQFAQTTEESPKPRH